MMTSDARKREAEQHHTHPDPAVRALIEQAEARGRAEGERVVARRELADDLADEYENLVPKTHDPYYACPVCVVGDQILPRLRAALRAAEGDAQ